MAHPVADGAFVGEGQGGDVVIGGGLRDAAAGFADDDHDLAFVIQLVAFGRADQGLACGGETAGKAGEQRHEGRGVGAVFVFGVAVGEVDTDTEDFFWVGDGDLQGDVGGVKVGGQASGKVLQVGQSLGRDGVAQGGPCGAGGKVNDAFVGLDTVGGTGLVGEADQVHDAMIGWAVRVGSCRGTPAKGEPFSNQLFGAAAPHRVWRCGSRRPHLIGSRSGSTVW